MKRAFIFFPVAIIAILLGVLPAFGAATSLKSDGNGKWLMHDKNGSFVGTITKTEDKIYRIENATGEWGGNIWPDGNWSPPWGENRDRLIVRPAAARLYLDALEALQSAGLL